MLCLSSIAHECDLCCQEKTIFYHKCKVEQYAPYTQDDGLVQRITLYKASTKCSEKSSARHCAFRVKTNAGRAPADSLGDP